MSSNNEENYSSSDSDPDSDDYSDEYEDFENYYNTDDYTTIFLAVHNGDLNGFRALVNKDNLEESVNSKRMLHVAAARGHLPIVNLLVKNGAKLNVRDFKRRTPFYIALQQNNVDVAEFLLENGARVNIPRKDGRTTLHVAIKTENIKIVESVLEQGDKVNVLDDMSNTKPIDFAASLNNIELVKLLLKYGAKMDESDEFCEDKNKVGKRMTALHFAAKVGNLEMVKLLMSNGFDKIDVENCRDITPFALAISKHRLDIVKYMFESGSKIDEDMYLIDLCESDKHINILKYLLDQGVKLVTDYEKTPLYYALVAHEYKLWRYLLTCYSKIDSLLCSKETELHSAVRNNNIQSVKEILNTMKLNSLSGDLGQFAVFIAVENGNEEMLKILLEAGCSLESCFRDKLTPLHIAATFDHTRLVEILLRHGARINSETRALHLPLDFAAAIENVNMIKFLIDSGANSLRKKNNISSLRYLFDECKIKKTITPSMYQDLLKVTEMLLIAGDLEQKDDFHVSLMLRGIMKLSVSSENEQTSIGDNEDIVNSEGKERKSHEIVRCVLSYLTPKLLKDILNNYLSYSYYINILENIVDFYDSKFVPDSHLFNGYEWSDLFLVNEIKRHDTLLKITRQNLCFSVLLENDNELLKLIIARLELLKPNCTRIMDCFNSWQYRTLIDKFQNECREQIKIMRKTKFMDKLNWTFYDILVKFIDRFASCIRDVKLLNSNEMAYDKFPAYKNFLKLRIEKVKRRRELIDISTNCLYHYIERNYKIQFSTIDIEEILQYLSMSDLVKLSMVFSQCSHC